MITGNPGKIFRVISVTRQPYKHSTIIKSCKGRNTSKHNTDC